MSVRSLHVVLNDFALNYLAVVVPEDISTVVGVSVGLAPDVCEGGHIHGFIPRCRVTLWASFPPATPLGREVHVHVEGSLDAWMIEDGDTDPLESILEGLWEQAQFLSLMKPVMADLQNVYAEVGPFIEPADSDHEYEDEGTDDGE